MRYSRFRIKKFKGIADATLHLSPAGSNIFTLIGLNESGKTSILEAISNFKPDSEYEDLVRSGDADDGAHEYYIPKQYQSNFTDAITIEAWVNFEHGEIAKLIEPVEKSHKVLIDASSIPNPIKIIKTLKYEDSQYKSSNYVILDMTPRIKSGGERKYRTAEYPHQIWKDVASKITSNLPQVLYFPTFLFSIPDKIVLNPGPEESSVNAVYRQIIEDVASSLPNKVSVTKHIVERMIGSAAPAGSGSSVIVLGSQKQRQAMSALDDISNHISNTVFEEWEKILPGKVYDRDLFLQPGVEIDTGGNQRMFVQFSLRDGVHSYSISERSLGFRWFFAFMLFTVYRSIAKRRNTTLFLLDEPASNLHAKAQTQLLESFPRIAEDGNILIYSTHSHYMIEPRWLEQASIVTNDALERAEEFDRGGSRRANPTNISIKKYRQFVGENPDRWTYFLPVLDQLDYSPSKLDLVKPSLLVEGKGDYAIIEYVRRVILNIGGDIAIVPTRGATGMDDLIALFLGWGVKFWICLDDDKEGLTAKRRYITEWGLDHDRVATLGDISDDLVGKRVEGLLAESDLSRIAESYEIDLGTLTKEQIRLFFAERLASEEVVECSEELKQRVRAILEWGSIDKSGDGDNSSMAPD